MARPATAAVRLLTGEREPVHLATTANIALSGLQTIDGVLTEVGDRVLVKNQTDATTNGIYTASAGPWYRASDARTSRTMQKGTTVHVQQGTVGAGNVYSFQTFEPNIGTDNIVLAFYTSDTALEDVNAAAAAAAASAAAASGSAISASGSASAASTSAGAAATSASSASTSASTATTQATNASGSASSASTSATNAGNSATAAAGSAAAAAADRVQTGLDRTAVANDKATVAADKAIVAADKGTVAADKAIVAADKATVAADKATVLGYRNEVEADRAEVETNKNTVAADKAIVAADKATVAADKGIVAADKATVAADKGIVAADKATTLTYRDDAYDWSSAAEDAPVNDGTHAGFSAFHWSKKAEAAAGGGVSSVAAAGGGLVEVNNTDPANPILDLTAGAKSTLSGAVQTGGATALSVLGRSANSVGNRADIAAGTDGHVLRRSGTAIGFGTILSAAVSDLATTITTAIAAAVGVTVQAFDAALSSKVRQNSKSAAYTLVLSDDGKHIFHPSADTTARIWTIPANATVAFSIGTAITFVNQNGAGVITIAITTDTMRLAGAGTTGSRTLAANGMATALKVTATEWIIGGTGLT